MNIHHPPSNIECSNIQTHHPSPITKQWYAIYVRSRHEKCVHAELQQKGIESSLPLMSVTRQWSDRKKKVEVPLFRGYVFVKIDLTDGKFPVLTTTGVVKFVTFCNKTVSIPEEQMFWLNQLLLSEFNMEHETDFPVGSEVDVVFGPLKGLRGKVKHKNSGSRLVVWFDAIMQGVSVEIDPGCLKEAMRGNKINHFGNSYAPLAASNQPLATSNPATAMPTADRRAGSN